MDDSAILEAGASSSCQGSLKRRSLARGLARHTLGLLMLAGVIFLWTASNFLSSSIFANNTYAKPFFMTYLNSVVLISASFPRLLRIAIASYQDGTLLASIKHTSSQPSKHSANNASKKHQAHKTSEDSPLLASDTTTSSTSQRPRPQHPSHQSEDEEYLNLRSTLHLALRFFLLWFGANYFASACLQYAAVASATILTSTASIWTLIVGVASGIEKFTWTKLCGVLASFCGIVLISHVDLSSSGAGAVIPSSLRTKLVGHRALDDFPDKTTTETVVGDAMALFSAVIYGFYSISLKRATTPITTTRAQDLSTSTSSLLTTLMPSPTPSLHMPTFFSLVGALSALLLLPLFPLLHLTGLEPFAIPSTPHIWTILLTNALSSILSDILWAYALVFTSPLVVTVGLSMTIPLSLVGEMVIQGRYKGWVYWCGALVVLLGFVGVEREERGEELEAEAEAELQEEDDGDDDDDGDIGASQISVKSVGVTTVNETNDGDDDEDNRVRDRLYRQSRGYSDSDSDP